MAADLAVLALTLLQFQGLCDALSCHICDSVDGPGVDYCAVVTSGVDSTDVTGNVSYTDTECDKYCIKTEVTRGAEYTEAPDFVQSVARSCGSQCIDYCYPITNPSKLEVCVHCCATDLCNGACAVTFGPAAIFGGWTLVCILNMLGSSGGW